MALFVSLLDFGTVPTVWHALLLCWTLELFRQCGIVWFSTGLWNCSDSVALCVSLLDFGTVPTIALFVFLLDLDLLRQCDIICLSVGLWNCLESVILFGFLQEFGTAPTVWRYLFLYWTLELF